jgi:hypothetical protein
MAVFYRQLALRLQLVLSDLLQQVHLWRRL